MNILTYNSNNKEIPVMTTKQVAEAFGVSEEVIRRNYSNNKERFTETKHYYKLTGEDVKNFHNLDIPRATTVLTLWTEKGVARLSKSIGTNTAWDIFEELEDTYFKVKENKLYLPSYQIEDPTARAYAWIEDEINKLGEIGKVIFHISSYEATLNHGNAKRSYKMYTMNKRGRIITLRIKRYISF